MQITKQDLYKIFELAEGNHINLYHSISKSDFMQQVDKTAEIIESLPFLQAKYEIAKLFALFRDGHTLVRFGSSYSPIKYRLIDGKLYIKDVQKDYAPHYFSEVTSINGVDVGEILPRITQIACADTDAWAHYQTEFLLSNNEVLQMLGVLGESDINLQITVQQNEQAQTFYLPLEDWDFYKNKGNYRLYNKDSITVFEYKKMQEFPKYPYTQFWQDIVSIIQPNDKIIVDLRECSGGNNTFFMQVDDYLAKNNITGYVLVGNETFSGGSLARYMLNSHGFTSVGEPMGNGPRRYGNAKPLGYNGINFAVSTTFFDAIKYCKLKEDTTNAPDVVIPETIDDLRTGQDRAMQYCITQLTQTRELQK